ncbi:MAG: hypothetical protein HQL17_04200 [Candidatus Omnitrophica bacterium]|nr:hypothetical protein [Candidatus Omnitrophota bacterium]
MECLKEQNLKDCGCTYPGCSRKGMCCQCVRYHRAKGAIPGCFFPRDTEKTYDRSLTNLLERLRK